jgi:hypothetical protein
MANTFKSGSNPLGITNSLFRNNFTIGLDGILGPTIPDTGYYNGITPPNGGYTVYQLKPTQGPSIRIAPDNNELITIATQYGGTNISTATDALNYLNSLSNTIVTNFDYENIVTDGLVFNVDAGFTPSYPTTGSTWYGLSGGNITGSLINTPVFNSSRSGSLLFNGSNNYVNFGNPNLGIDLTDKSFCAWVNLSASIANPSSIIDKQFDNTPPSNNYGGWGFWVGSNRKLWWWNMPNEDIIDTGSATIGVNVWTHIAVTYNNSTKNASFYINGALNSSISNSNIVEQSSGTQQLAIAAARLNQINQTGYINGAIANVLVYNRVLSITEIQQNYNNQKGRFGL